jgi:transposase InsO family protein
MKRARLSRLYWRLRWRFSARVLPAGRSRMSAATVLDFASRRMAGIALREHHDAELARAAMVTAAAVRGGHIAGLTSHSDKGGEWRPVRRRVRQARRDPVDGAGWLRLPAPEREGGSTVVWSVLCPA